jgi:hypothetical protein
LIANGADAVTALNGGYQLAFLIGALLLDVPRLVVPCLFVLPVPYHQPLLRRRIDPAE